MASALKKSFAAEHLKLHPKKKTGLWVFLAVLGVVVAAGGYALYSHFGTKEEPAPEKEEIKSIAVLPFVDLSPEKDQEYFCDGMAEEIINTMTQVEGLLVTARTSAFKFKGKDVDITEIGKQLNVETVLEGSVRKEGNQLRISAQLINVKDGFHIWSQKYDREMAGVFAIQDEISMAIVEALKGRLLPEEREVIAKRPTDNLEAYDLYLLGRHYWEQHTDDSISKSGDYFLQAIDRDPDFALAYTGIADCYNMAGLSYQPAVYPLARAAAKKALELDDTLAEAYVSLAWVSMYYDWDWTTAENALKRAIELNPGYYLAHQWYTDYLLFTDRLDEALEEIKRAEELNPQYYHAVRLRMDIYMKLDRYEEAMEQFYKLKELNQDYAYYCLGKLHTYQGNYEDAIAVIQKLPNSSYLGYIYALKGERVKAEQELDKYIERRKKFFATFDIEEAITFFRLRTIERYFPSVDVEQIIRMLHKHREEPYISAIFTSCSINTALGNFDKAFEILEIACEMRSSWLVQITFCREFERLHKDPRYKELMKRIGLE